MTKRFTIVVAALLLVTLTACRTATVARDGNTPTVALTDTPVPTSTAEPTLTPTPTRTPFPTANEVAPEKTFTDVGGVAHLSGEHGVAGKAIVAGLQTLIIQGFSYDGKGSPVDIRLVQGEDYEHPAAILMELEDRAYDSEMLYMIIPSSAGPGTADHIVVYAPDAHKVYASATFQ